MAMKQEQKAGASLRASDMVEGGGLLDDVEATITNIRFALWDYGGRVADQIPAVEVELETDNGEKATQYWSAGKSKDWVPSADGRRLEPIGNAKGINVSSNAGILLTSIVNAGFPEDKIGDDISVFEGMVAHFIRVPAPKRSGLAKAPRADGRDFGEATILTVDKIVKLPWEKGKVARGGATSKASGAGARAPEQAQDLTTKATETAMAILADNPGGIPKAKLATTVFQSLKDDPDRNAIVQIVYKDDFLSAGPWKFEKGVVSL
jgi:hypothetical protein